MTYPYDTETTLREIRQKLEPKEPVDNATFQREVWDALEAIVMHIRSVESDIDDLRGIEW